MSSGAITTDTMSSPSSTVIVFNSAVPHWNVLSNFYRCKLFDVRHDLEFYSVEAYFQAQKFAGRPNARELMEKNFAGPDVEPLRAKRRGRSVRMTPEEVRAWTGEGGGDGDADQNARRNQAMREALRVKFSDPTCRSVLLATGDARLIECLPGRQSGGYWGVKKNGEGLNMLGRMLMEERERERANAAVRYHDS